MKTEKIQFRISEEDRQKLAEVAADHDLPVSQIIREGLREKIAQLSEKTKTGEAREKVAS